MSADRLALLADEAVRRAFASALGTARMGRTIEWHDVLPTTMDRAAALAREDAPDGTVVVADHQTAGRGRRGRAWGLGPPGSQLLASWLLSVEADRAPLFTVLAAVPVLRAARSLGVEGLSVKWPNDLLLDGRKVAGILAVAAAERRVVLGTGVDVHTREHPQEVRDVVTSFAAHGHAVDRLALLARLARELDALVEGGDAARVDALAEWRRASSVLGRRVRVDDGTRSIEGEAVDVADDGALLVRRGTSVERIVAGDVTLRTTA